MAYLDAIGARGTLIGPGGGALRFSRRRERRALELPAECRTGAVVAVSAVAARSGRAADADYLQGMRLMRAGPEDRVADLLPAGTTIERRCGRR